MPCFPVATDDSTRWFSCLDRSDARDILVIVSLVALVTFYAVGFYWTATTQLPQYCLLESASGPLALGCGALAMIAYRSGEKDG